MFSGQTSRACRSGWFELPRNHRLNTDWPGGFPNAFAPVADPSAGRTQYEVADDNFRLTKAQTTVAPPPPSPSCILYAAEADPEPWLGNPRL